MRHEIKNGEPDPNVLCALRHWPPRLAYKLLSIEANLHPVVEQREERGERKGSYEDGDEAELENCKVERKGECDGR